jgi:hypothetical protein
MVGGRGIILILACFHVKSMSASARLFLVSALRLSSAASKGIDTPLAYFYARTYQLSIFG